MECAILLYVLFNCVFIICSFVKYFLFVQMKLKLYINDFSFVVTVYFSLKVIC